MKANHENHEKPDFSKNEDISPARSLNAEWDPHEEKQLIRKVDKRLLPILGALYSIALIDRTNVSTRPSPLRI